MRLAVLSILAFSMVTGCDISGGPDAVSRRFQTALRPYFPNARARAVPDQGIIIGLTCVEGAGPQLVAQVADFVARNQEVARLRTLRRWGPLLGSPTYHHVQLGFDRSIVALNVDTWKLEYPVLPGNYQSNYRHECGLAGPGLQSDHPTAQSSYVWIGHFSAKLATMVNGQTTVPVVQSLGIYNSDDDFESHRAAETKARIALIRSQLAEQKLHATEVRLDWVEKVAVPESGS